jgi:hypothetical protein
MNHEQARDAIRSLFSLDHYDSSADNLRGIRIRGDHLSAYRMRIHRARTCREHERARRGRISQFSDASRKRMLWSLRECVFGWRIKSFCTITYPADFPTDGAEFKLHFKRLMDAMQYRRKGIRLFWFLEFQKRGAPHLHIYSSRTIDWEILQQLWDTASNNLGGRSWVNPPTPSQVKRPWKYALKYSAKLEQKTVPDFIANPGRFWGWRNRPPAIAAKISTYWEDVRDHAVDVYQRLVDVVATGDDLWISTLVEFIDVYACSSVRKSIALKVATSIDLLKSLIKRQNDLYRSQYDLDPIY